MLPVCGTLNKTVPCLVEIHVRKRMHLTMREYGKIVFLHYFHEQTVSTELSVTDPAVLLKRREPG